MYKGDKKMKKKQGNYKSLAPGLKNIIFIIEHKFLTVATA